MEHVFRYEVFPLCWFTGIVVIGSTLESTFYDLYKTRGDNGAGPFSAWGGASQASIKNNVTVLSAKMTQGLSTACIPNIEVCPISRGNRFVSIRLNQWVDGEVAHFWGLGCKRRTRKTMSQRASSETIINISRILRFVLGISQLFDTVVATTFRNPSGSVQKLPIHEQDQ